jgi:transmembrane sensor
VDKHFESIEEVIADEQFQAWYFRSNSFHEKMWEQWLLKNPDYVPLVQEAIQYLKDIQLEEKEVPLMQTEEAHQRLMENLDSSAVVEMHQTKIRWWIPAAASILVVIAGLALLKSKNNEVVLNSTFGKIAEYRLPDGSHVILNANSTVSLKGEWEAGKVREVWIKGEGFFKVQKTAAAGRFIVHTDKMDIMVTGTEFNVVNTEYESSALLTEGSVIIKTKDGNEISMKPGDFVRFENNMIAKRPIEEEKVLAWKQSKLDFYKTPIPEVARIITRHYGIKVNITDKEAEAKTISGIMPNNNLEVLLAAIEGTGEFKVTRTEKEIIISNPQ